MDRIGNAVNNFFKRYACSQDILTEYCELFDLDNETALKLAAGFAAGMRNGRTCGTAEGTRKAKEENLFYTLCPKYVQSAAEILEGILNK